LGKLVWKIPVLGTGIVLSEGRRQKAEGRRKNLIKQNKVSSFSCRLNRLGGCHNKSFSKLDKLQSLKAFITGDPIDKERKGQDEKEFIPTAIAG
jgi:hypothetical protein